LASARTTIQNSLGLHARPAMAFVDAATGHFHLGQVVDDEQHGCLRTLLAQLRPDEIVINEQSLSRDAYTLLRRAVPDGLFNPLPRTAFWADKAACTKALEAGKYFDKDTIGAAAGAALGVCLLELASHPDGVALEDCALHLHH